MFVLSLTTCGCMSWSFSSRDIFYLIFIINLLSFGVSARGACKKITERTWLDRKESETRVRRVRQKKG
jgi:hypothetical protein